MTSERASELFIYDFSTEAVDLSDPYLRREVPVVTASKSPTEARLVFSHRDKTSEVRVARIIALGFRCAWLTGNLFQAIHLKKSAQPRQTIDSALDLIGVQNDGAELKRSFEA